MASSSSMIPLGEYSESRRSPRASEEAEMPARTTTATDDDDDEIPPADHGRGAYLVLLGCALVQAPVWGYSLAFGILQEYYSAHNDAGASRGAIASIGTSQNGLMYLMMPLTFTALTRYPRLRPWCGPLGLAVNVASLVGSSFTAEVGPLIATQGVVYAVGCGLLFSPTSLYLDDWFVERKGMAYGIMWASKALVGVVMPFLMRALLDRYGLRATLQAWAAASAILTLPLLFLLRPRTPLAAAAAGSASAGSPRSPSFSFMRYGIFWMLQAGNVIQSLGYQMPSTYLASYAEYIGLAHLTGPIFLALFSLASVPGALVHGMLGDRLAGTTVILVSSIGSALAVFLLWGFSLQISVLAVFSIMYGFFAGGFSSTWSAVLHEMKRHDAGTDTGLVFGMLMGGRGVGFVLSGPISGILLDAGGRVRPDISSYSSEYGPMIICTGLTAMLGAWGWFWSLGKPCRRIGARLHLCWS